MPAITTAILIGVSVAGIAVQQIAAAEQREAQKAITNESKKAEQIRQQQASLEQERKRRDIIRTMQASRARSASAAVNSGAIDSSGYQGASGSIVSQSGDQIQDVNASADLGNKLFDINSNIAGFKQEALESEAISDLGRQIQGSAMSISRIGSSLFEGKSVS